MIWYRHWLELRYRIVAVAVASALASFVYLGLQYTPAVTLRQGLWMAENYPEFAYLLPLVGPEQMMAVLAQFQICSILSVSTGLLIAGSGFGLELSFRYVPTLVYFPLTLPVPRVQWVWTRLAAGFAVVVSVNVFLLLADALVLRLIGRTAPMGYMAAVNLRCIGVAFAVLAVTQFLQLNRGRWWGVATMTLLFLSVFWIVPATRVAVTHPTQSLNFVAGGLVAYALSLWTVQNVEV